MSTLEKMSAAGQNVFLFCGLIIADILEPSARLNNIFRCNMKNRLLSCVLLLMVLLAVPTWSQAQQKSESLDPYANETQEERDARMAWFREAKFGLFIHWGCLLYTSPSPRDQRGSRMPSSA